MKIIGIMGRDGNGKSTIANAIKKELEAKGKVVAIVPFAGKVKEMCTAIGLSYEEVYGGHKLTPNHTLLDGKTPREFMRLLGTEFGRNLVTPNLWSNAWMKAVQLLPTSIDVVIADDMRFPNEIQAVRTLGGVVFAVQRKPENYWSRLYNRFFGHASNNIDFKKYNVPIIDNSGLIVDTLKQIPFI